MANRYANLPGPSKIKDTYQLINTGFDGVEADMDAKPDKSIAKVNDVDMGTDDTLTVEGSTGITITTNQQDKKVIITATGTSTPGAHGPSHNNDGADPIPDLQDLTNDLAAHKADYASNAVQDRRESVSGDWNSYTDPGTYSVNDNSWDGSNYPSGAHEFGVLAVFRGNNNALSQMYLPHAPSGTPTNMYFRAGYVSGNWRSWVSVASVENVDQAKQDAIDYAKGYGLGTEGQYSSDLDSATASGYYYTDGSTLNAPTSADFIIFVNQRPSNSTAQIAVRRNGKEMYFRTNTGGGWEDWVQIVTDYMVMSGTGSPEGSVTADVGTLYRRTDTGQLWVKQTGTGNTGWGQVTVS